MLVLGCSSVVGRLRQPSAPPPLPFCPPLDEQETKNDSVSAPLVADTRDRQRHPSPLPFSPLNRHRAATMALAKNAMKASTFVKASCASRRTCVVVRAEEGKSIAKVRPTGHDVALGGRSRRLVQASRVIGAAGGREEQRGERDRRVPQTPGSPGSGTRPLPAPTRRDARFDPPPGRRARPIHPGGPPGDRGPDGSSLDGESENSSPAAPPGRPPRRPPHLSPPPPHNPLANPSILYPPAPTDSIQSDPSRAHRSTARPPSTRASRATRPCPTLTARPSPATLASTRWASWIPSTAAASSTPSGWPTAR